MVQNDSRIIASICVQCRTCVCNVMCIYIYTVYRSISEKRQAFLAFSHGWSWDHGFSLIKSKNPNISTYSTFLLELLVSQK